MTTTQLAAIAVPLLLKFAPIIGGPIASAVVSWLKASRLPFEGKTITTIAGALAAAAIVFRLALAWLTGTLDVLNVDFELTVIRDALAAAGFGAGVYSLAKADKPLLPGGPEFPGYPD